MRRPGPRTRRYLHSPTRPAGGWLVFGVRDRGGTLEMVGVMQVDKVQNEFLSTLRSRQKINRAIDVAEEPASGFWTHGEPALAASGIHEQG